MNRTFLIAAAAVALGLLLASTAFATGSRINGLSGGEKNITIRDQANIDALPQMLVFHGNQVDVDEVVGAAYGGMNIRYKLTDEAVLWLFGKKSPWLPVVKATTLGGNDSGLLAGLDPTGAVPPPTPAIPPSNPIKDPTNHQFGIGFATKLGEGLRLGSYLSIGGHRNDADGNNQYSNTLIDFAIGFGLDISETNNIDFGLNLKFGSFVNFQGGTDRYVGDGLMNIGLVAKGEFQVHQIAKLVPYVTFNYDGRAVSHTVRTDSPQHEALKGNTSQVAFALGADLAIAPAEGVLVQPGLGLLILNSAADGNKVPNGPITSQEAITALAPYYGFAAEAAAFDWLDFRVGARQTIVKTDVSNTLPTPQSNEKHTSTVLNTVTTGVGVKLRSWTIDVNMNPAWFNNGPHVATGNATGGWGIDFAAKYEW